MIHLDGRYFKDEAGRTLLLRGVNLSGATKVPVIPNGATWNKVGFYDHRAVSFVGRPFPLAEADEHFRRLKAWGFTFLRFLITWEAVEHAGPGIYDQEYLDFLYDVVKKADEHGINIFIDPHQDVWSRFTGGDGAPGWTLEAAGFDLTRLNETGAAITHQEKGDPFPRMVWPTNYGKLAAGTMFTLFFAGRDFAPQCTVDGVNIQDYLQGHYINAVKAVALRLKGLPNVVGYDSLNEPSNGFIGEKDIRKTASGIPALNDNAPTMLQGMALGAGCPQTVDVYNISILGMRKVGTRLLNPGRVSAWLPGRADIWRQHGVWDLDANGQPVALKPDYFSVVNGQPISFVENYFKPFANRFAREIREIDPAAIIFIEGVPSQGELTWDQNDEPNVVHAAHWYDDVTLLLKRFYDVLTIDVHTMKLVLGRKKVRDLFVRDIREIVEQSDRRMNHAPTLIGETGIPFDMGGKKAYANGDFSMQINALDATMTALERNMVSFTLWNYTPDNSNERGDLWNDEDLSLFSRDQMTGSGSIDDGGRALEAALRPYPVATAGEPLHLKFDMKRRVFEYSFRHTRGVTEPSEFYIPSFQYPHGCRVEVSDGSYEIDLPGQRLVYRHSEAFEFHTVKILPTDEHSSL